MNTQRHQEAGSRAPHAKRALTVALASIAMVATMLFGSTATASPGAEDIVPQNTCVGSSFSGTLGPDRSICWGAYRVIMQTNGDLVLWNTNTGRACWRSETNTAPGADTSATFHQNIWGRPYVDIESTSQGRLKRVVGAHRTPHWGTNANVNRWGEFWIGYKKIGWC